MYTGTGSMLRSNNNLHLRSADIHTKLQCPVLPDQHKYLRLSLFYSILNNRTGTDKGQYMRQPTDVPPHTDHSLKLCEYVAKINTLKKNTPLFFSKDHG